MENKLVIMKDQQAVTTSLQVAKAFSKKHNHLIRDINSILEGMPKNGHTQHMFAKGNYINKQNGQKYGIYYMNRDGFTILAMGFNGKKALEFKLKYIEAFNKMEQVIKENNLDSYMINDPIKRATKWIEEEKEREELKIENKKMKPKSDYFDTQMKNPGLLTVTEIAKSHGMTAIKLNKFLNEHKVIYKKGKSWVPYDNYQDKGYCDYEKWSNSNNDQVVPLLKWTQLGEKFIDELLAKSGILSEARKFNY